MEAWREYIRTILEEGQVQDMAIVSHIHNCQVLASKPGGLLAALSPREGQMIIGEDRRGFLQTGITICGKKYCVIRDNLLSHNDWTMDLRSKEKVFQSICIGFSPKFLILLMGQRGVHGGILNKRMHDILKDMNM
ncbi:profilin-3 [Ranitomeya variabilis]|uniref:profilin-3 n=1 Tax=Ranitomeya variabilis TaxID=490064 RepID=UPI004056684F